MIPTRRLAAQWPALLSYIPDYLIKMARFGPDPYDKYGPGCMLIKKSGWNGGPLGNRFPGPEFPPTLSNPTASTSKSKNRAWLVVLIPWFTTAAPRVTA